MTGLSGLRALVTGGASGIGLATARALAVLDLEPTGVPERLRAFRADVGDDTSVRGAVEEAAEGVHGPRRLDLVAIGDA